MIMENINVEETLKEIKRSFRLVMNGVASQSMREKGVDYKINWGVSFIELKRMAARYGKNYDLAIALWKENIRECKILATLIMPEEQMMPDMVDLWMEQIDSQEMAEMAAFNLFSRLPYIPAKAFSWIASEREVCRICGYQVLARLFMKGEQPDERGINELIDQSISALHSESLPLRHAATTCLQRFAGISEECEMIVKSALKNEDFQIL